MSQISQIILIRKSELERNKINNTQNKVKSSNGKFYIHFDKFLSKLEEDMSISNDLSSECLPNIKISR